MVGCIHVIQGWRDIPHQAHQEKGNLQNRVCEEVHPSDKLVIPGHGIEVDEES